MSTYQSQNLGAALSDVVAFDDGQDDRIRAFEYGAAQPTIRPVNLHWACTDPTTLTAAGVPGSIGSAFLRWDGAQWRYVAPIGFGPYLVASGAVPLTNPFHRGGQRLFNAGAATSAGDLVRYQQTLLRDGASGGLTANLNADGFTIANLAAPTQPHHAARLADLAGGGQFWYNTNRDAAGTGNPVKVEQASSPATTFTLVGFVPRRVRVRVVGRFHRQSDNSLAENGGVPPNVVFEGEALRYDAQTDGNDAGTPLVAAAGTITLPTFSNPTVRVELGWRSTPGSEGFALRFLYTDPNETDVPCWVRRVDNANVDGAVHVMAWG